MLICLKIYDNMLTERFKFQKNIYFREIRKRTIIKSTGFKYFLQSTKSVTIQRVKGNSKKHSPLDLENFDSHTFSLIQSSRGAKNKNKPKKSNVKEMLGFIGGEK